MTGQLARLSATYDSDRRGPPRRLIAKLSSGDREEMALLRGYHRTLGGLGVRDYPFEACLRGYRLSLLEILDRTMCVVTVFDLPEAQKRVFLEVILPPYLRAITDLDATELLPS